jgi:anti-sigma B factor antagonist
MTEALLDGEKLPDGTMRITIRGEIDLSNVGAVEQQMLDAISNQLSEVVVDLSGVTYVDSAGLRVLFTLGTRLESLQIRSGWSCLWTRRPAGSSTCPASDRWRRSAVNVSPSSVQNGGDLRHPELDINSG